MVDIKNLKNGDKSVIIIAQIREIGETREFDYAGGKSRVATSIIEDKTGSIDMPLFNEEIDRVKVGNIVKIINGYISEFKGIKQLRAGRYGKLEVIQSNGKKDSEDVQKEIKIDNKIKTPQQKETTENWCKKCGKTQDPVILEDYDGMCVSCCKVTQDERDDFEL